VRSVQIPLREDAHGVTEVRRGARGVLVVVRGEAWSRDVHLAQVDVGLVVGFLFDHQVALLLLARGRPLVVAVVVGGAASALDDLLLVLAVVEAIQDFLCHELLSFLCLANRRLHRRNLPRQPLLFLP